VGAQVFELERGDAVVVVVDVPHSYVNPGSEGCWIYSVMTYTEGRIRGAFRA